jgi:hypothetical protein
MLHSFLFYSHLDVRLHTGRVRLRPSTVHRQGVVYEVPADAEAMPSERHCNVSGQNRLLNAADRRSEYRLDEKCGVSSEAYL